MNKLWKTLAVACGCGLTIASLTACGSDNTGQGAAGAGVKIEAAGTIAGAGASSQKEAVQAWLAGLGQVAPKLKVTYDPVGSGAGITQFLSGAVAFAGTDEALKPEEIAASAKVCKDSKAFDIPAYVSPVVVGFNLADVKEINLKPETIAKIFKNEIKTWNDPQILADNPGAKLPAKKIIPVHRADKSGTTENFTDYLHKAAPEAWTFKPGKEWPLSGGEAGDKTAGVVQTIKAAEGTIGYLDASQAGGLGTVALSAGDGFIKYSAESAAKAVDVAKQAPGRESWDLALELDRKPKEAGAYPLVLVSYYAVCPAYKDEKTAALVKAYLTYVTSPEGQQMAAKAAGSAPLGKKIQDQIAESLKKMK